MRKALILSYVALVAVVLFTPGLGRSQERDHRVIHVLDGSDRVILRNGEFVRVEVGPFDRNGQLRAWNRWDRLEQRNDLRQLRELRNLERLSDLRGLRRLERLDRIQRLDRLNRWQRLDRFELDRDRNRERDNWF